MAGTPEAVGTWGEVAVTLVAVEVTSAAGATLGAAASVAGTVSRLPVVLVSVGVLVEASLTEAAELCGPLHQWEAGLLADTHCRVQRVGQQHQVLVRRQSGTRRDTLQVRR